MLVQLVTPPAQAQDDQELQYQLRQRNQVILELLERVEALERQLGIQPGRDKPQMPSADIEEPEPAEDVEAVPGAVVVDETLAQRALERSLTLDGVLLLPPGVFEIEPRITYARQEDTAPSFVSSGGEVIASETERNSDNLTTALLFRLGIPGDAQLEIELPYRWRRTETVTNVDFSPISTSSQSGDGAGDVRVTLAKTLLREDAHSPDVISRLSWDTDTGEMSDEGVGLGGGFHEVLGGLSFIKREDPVVFVGGVSYEYTFEENALQTGETVGASLGSYVALNPQTSMNFNLALAYRDETKLSSVERVGTDRAIGSVVIGGSTFIGRRSLLNLSVGLGVTEDADDFSLSLSLPVRF